MSVQTSKSSDILHASSRRWNTGPEQQKALKHKSLLRTWNKLWSVNWFSDNIGSPTKVNTVLVESAMSYYNKCSKLKLNIYETLANLAL
jgi:hypothetical protein